MRGELGELFERQPKGASLWLSARGTSMAPLLRGDDELKALRCGEEELSLGDIAILGRSDGALLAHLVVKKSPLRTASMTGVLDPGTAKPLGRAIAIRRKERVLHLPRLMGPALFAAHWLWTKSLRTPRLRGLLESVLERSAAPRRRLLGSFELRALRPGELELLRRHAPGSLGTGDEELAALLLPPNSTLGAFARGRLVALGLAQETPEGPTVRYLWVSPAARATGVEFELLARLLEHSGATRALVHAGQRSFIEALQAQGFCELGGQALHLFTRDR